MEAEPQNSLVCDCGTQGLKDHRITESLRLEKTSKIMMSSRQGGCLIGICICGSLEPKQVLSSFILSIMIVLLRASLRAIVRKVT